MNWKAFPLPNMKYGITVRLRASEEDFGLPPANTTPITTTIPLLKIPAPPLTVTDRFEAIHATHAKEYSVHVLSSPVQPLLLEHTGPYDRIHVRVGSNVKVTLLDQSQGTRFSRVTVHLEENAQLTFALRHKGNIWIKREAALAANTKLRWCEYVHDSKIAYSRTTNKLQGSCSGVEHSTVFQGSQGKYDLDVRNEHFGKHTKSTLHSKGVLRGTAKAINQGTIYIDPHAKGSDGYQKEEILLLDESAEADAIPQLDIRNHDVTCSHGASIAQVDKQQLHYLQSRGLSQDQAEKLIIDGFLTSSLRTFPEAP